MTEITLSEFLANGGTQSEVAEALGLWQSAVSQMVATGRDVRIQIDESGAIVSACEVKPIGRSKVA